MPQDYGIPTPAQHHADDLQPPVRFVVLIDTDSGRVARLFLQDHRQVAELQAGAEEVTLMTRDVAATRNAADASWDDALSGHSAAERRGAEVYELAV